MAVSKKLDHSQGSNLIYGSGEVRIAQSLSGSNYLWSLLINCLIKQISVSHPFVIAHGIACPNHPWQC